ncbi:MAG: hypothetical protein UR26_C0007G0023 [candidate division TM6 bacterium GW2011_GWF2_32_72]|nr:MAG: hypothetical protein UR26_C0007G0023 [candidate division TM6 bacterium GW2011_GWF2_32_72]
MKRIVKFLSLAALVGCSLLAQDRAPREDTPSATANDAVVSPIIDVALIMNDLANIKGQIGNVNQDVSADTVLGVLGDANTILTGSSISEALSELKDTTTEGFADLKQTVTNGFADLTATVTDCCADLKQTVTNGFADLTVTVTDGFADLKVTLTDILGQVSDPASDDTVLGVLGDADTILSGSSISAAIKELIVSGTWSDGTPITAAMTISVPGLYFVANDFTGDVAIASDNVTIEGHGRTITGTISATGYDHICIHELRVQNPGSVCLDFNTCLDICLKHIFATDGTIGFNFDTCYTIKMEDCKAADSTTYGLSFDTCADIVIDQLRSEYCTANDGLYAVDVQNIVVAYSQFYGNTLNGMTLDATSSAVLLNCGFTNNVVTGLSLINTTTATLVQDCKFVANTNGVVNTNPTGVIFLNNVATGNLTADYTGVVSATVVHAGSLGTAGTYDNIYTGVTI